VSRYTVVWTTQGKGLWHEIKDKRIRDRLLEVSASLADDPYLRGAPLTADLSGWQSLHWGRWRLVYSVDEAGKVVNIHVVGMRAQGKNSDIYAKTRRLLNQGLIWLPKEE